MRIKSSVIFILLFFIYQNLFAGKIKKRFYFSWGYNREWYAKNNINILQNSLQSKYSFLQVKGVDKAGWTTGIFDKDLTIPQYNYRLGYRINSRWSGELNFDHTKYQVPEQEVHISGMYQGRTTDSSFRSNANNLSYQLNNGANFFLFNAVRNFNLLNSDSSKINIQFLTKGGIGFTFPHVENSIMNEKNKPHFQFGGFDTGIEICLQINFAKIFYMEYSNKVVYAAFRNLKIYSGTASQNLACYEMVFSAGIRF